jgi:hypothetical protein
MKTLQEIIMEKVKEQSTFPFYSKNSKNFKDNMKGVDAEYLLSNSVKVVSKSGKQQLEITKDGHIGVTDGWKSVWITVYSDGKWASDTPEFINKGIKDFLDRNASRVDDLADGFRGSKSVKEAKLELWDEVNLATHWLSALVNGDSSGLSDEEEEKFDKWESKLPKGYTIDYGDLEDTDFKIDVVSGLRATTVRVKIYAQGK